MYDINLIITTYNRSEMLDSLLMQVYEQNPPGLVIHIHNDGSSGNYSPIIKKHNKKLNIRYFYHNHFGKKRYWALINRVFRYRARAKYYIMLPDDDILVNDFFNKIIALWQEIKDPDKICLMPSINIERKWVGCWTGVTPEKEGNVYNCGYVDMRFICENEFFRAVGDIEQIPLSRWYKNETLSSGVGAQISNKLHNNGLKMYIAADDLTYQVDHPKLMNPNVTDRKW